MNELETIYVATGSDPGSAIRDAGGNVRCANCGGLVQGLLPLNANVAQSVCASAAVGSSFPPEMLRACSGLVLNRTPSFKARVAALLRTIEGLYAGEFPDCCPVCRANNNTRNANPHPDADDMSDHHAADCELAALLRECEG